jgi:2-phosphosulfolactate phosphatase
MPAPDLPPPPTFDVPTRRVLASHLHMHDSTPESLAGCVVIVIDALRASVTITKALHEGAHAVLPALTADEARTIAHDVRECGGPTNMARVLLGGERGGVKIEGFDLDNSPASYTRERVADAWIVFTTSNGTAGLRHAAHAARVLVGSFANLSAVCDAVKDDERPVHILCCGTRDDVSLDDCLPAGAMAERLVAAGRQMVTDDSGRLCVAAWRSVSGSHERVRAMMRDSRGGRNLVRLGMGDDVDYCATLDTLPVVPEFDLLTGCVSLPRRTTS